MSIDSANDAWMGAPDSNIRDGKRWGKANKDMPFVNGEFREQKIGDKVIRHRIKKNT